MHAAIANEEWRQRENLELIASENYASRAVREAMASPLSNTGAHGYRGRRCDGGCTYVDVAETLAIERLERIFGAEHANVQPHSGAQANMAVMMAVLDPGDTVLGMSLAHGGHLTHGTKVSFSGQVYNAVEYGVRKDTELIDHAQVRSLAREFRPKLIIAGASAYPRVMDYAPFAEIAEEVGALLMVDMAHVAGLVAVGLHPSPVPFADFVTSTTNKTLRGPHGGFILSTAAQAQAVDNGVFPGTQGGPLMNMVAAKAVAFGEALTPAFAAYARAVIDNARAIGDQLARAGVRLVSGGTDTHLLLLDLTTKGLTGDVVVQYLDEINVTANKNAIPFDTQKPTIASGIRLGSQAITARGFGLAEACEVGTIIAAALDDVRHRTRIEQLRGRVADLTAQFGVP